MSLFYTIKNEDWMRMCTTEIKGGCTLNGGNADESLISSNHDHKWFYQSYRRRDVVATLDAFQARQFWHIFRKEKTFFTARFQSRETFLTTVR
jgi:hypothetical protein